MTEHELPPDPDLDDLPDEIAQAEGPLTLTGVDEDWRASAWWLERRYPSRWGDARMRP